MYGKGNQAAGVDQMTKKPFRPLTRKNNIPPSVLSPYLLCFFARLIGLSFILVWRLQHPNHKAMWLWAISVACEIWFAFSWLLDELPKLRPVKRTTDLNLLKEKFETPYGNKSDLPGIDIFVTTADPLKEPPLVTANTILSILAADYPAQKLACYISDDGGSLITREAMDQVAKFATIWVPFCRKHDIEPRNPDIYFNTKKDPFKNKGHPDFVKDYGFVKLKYDQFMISINGLLEFIKKRSKINDDPIHISTTPIPTLREDGTEWPGTWIQPTFEGWPDHSKGDHESIVEVAINPGIVEPIQGLNFNEVDTFIPMLVYLSREKRPGYDHNKKAGSMNALVRASAVMSNGSFILNLDCDHYIYNSKCLREGMCFMMDRGGDKLCYVQFPQRFDGIDPSDRYANKNTVFFDVNMRGLDGIQGPYYVGTGCLFRRIALYGIDPPDVKFRASSFWRFKKQDEEIQESTMIANCSIDEEEESLFSPFGTSSSLNNSVKVADSRGRPLQDHPSVKNGREPGALKDIEVEIPQKQNIDEAKQIISCWYEDNTAWGDSIGWVYGSITEDVLTGYGMHNRGWRSAYCVTKPDAFRGTAPINLTDRLHQALRWATGSVEIFFSSNNAWFASPRMKILQRLAYINLATYPFTSIFVTLYSFLPALCFLTGKFFVQTLDTSFLTYLLIITVAQCLLGLLEIKWSGITLEEYWRNEQFWLIGGTSSHLFAVLQGLLKALSGVEIAFSVTSKSASDDEDEFADLYIVKWTPLMIPPILILATNLLAIAVGFSRAIYSKEIEWGKLIGGVFLSFWVLAHMYPFAEGLKGKGSMPGIIFIWCGLIAMTIGLIWVN